VTANLLLHHSPDLRNYDIANQILKDLNLKSIRLLTNNPDKIKQINESGIKVVERIPMIPNLWKENNIATNSNNNSISSTSSISGISGSISIGNNNSEELNKYLKVKVEKMRHLLNIPEILLK
jgi:GTP cyclohydrolase II